MKKGFLWNASGYRGRTGDQKLVVTHRGLIRVEQLAPTVLRHTVMGEGTMALYEPIIESCDTVLGEHGELLVMIDSWDQERLDPDFRAALMNYLDRQRNRECSALMLVRSRFTQLASIMDQPPGRARFEVFADISEWERRCGQFFPGITRRPLEPGHDQFD